MGIFGSVIFAAIRTCPVVTNSDLSEGMESVTLYELLERSAESALELQRDDGSFPPGQNYTYNEPATPVNTTSHWTIVLTEAFNLTEKEKFRVAANASVDYLLSKEARPHGYTFYCRDTPSADRCNGLVGQAYPIKALSYAGSVLGRSDATETAKKVFELHPFREEIGLWERVEITGEKLSFDRTLNHQILFAAGAVFLPSKSAKEKINCFLDNLVENMATHSDGTIKHYARPPLKKIIRLAAYNPRYINMLINELAYHYYTFSPKRKKKEENYQPVNLRGLAQLNKHFSTNDFWSCEKFRSVNKNNQYTNNIQNHGSTVPHICAAWSSFIFDGNTHNVADELKSEFENSINLENFLFESNNDIDVEKSSLVSFLVGLPNVEIHFDE